MNDVLELYGILSVDPVLSVLNNDERYVCSFLVTFNFDTVLNFEKSCSIVIKNSLFLFIQIYKLLILCPICFVIDLCLHTCIFIQRYIFLRVSCGSHTCIHISYNDFLIYNQSIAAKIGHLPRIH